jgi:hypothetical protein
VAGSCEHSDEPLGSSKGGNFLPSWQLLTFQGGLCSMELVNFELHLWSIGF